jgi:hypothetical protein
MVHSTTALGEGEVGSQGQSQEASEGADEEAIHRKLLLLRGCCRVPAVAAVSTPL